MSTWEEKWQLWGALIAAFGGVFFTLVVEAYFKTSILPINETIPYFLFFFSFGLFTFTLVALGIAKKEQQTSNEEIVEAIKLSLPSSQVRARLIQGSRSSEQTGKAYREASNIILGAKKRILAISFELASYDGHYGLSYSKKSAQVPERIEYYDSALSKIHDPDFIYQRILQINPNQDVWEMITPDTVGYNHCLKLIEMEEKNNRSYVRRVSPMFPTSFIIVDNTHILFPISARSAKGANVFFRGYLVIEDIHGKLIEEFEEIFQLMFGESVNIEEPSSE